MQNIQVNTAATLGPWSYLKISTSGRKDAFDEASLQDVIRSFHRALGPTGVGVNAPGPIAGQTNTVEGAHDQQIENTLRKAPGNVRDPRLMLIILPNPDPILYNRVKYLGDLKLGIHTVCVVGERFMRLQGQAQYFANVALKFNLKLGGINQQIETARLGIISKNKTLVVGIDVTQPSPQSTSNAPSVAGMVASIDSYLTQ